MADGIIMHVYTSLGRGQQRDVDLVKIISGGEKTNSIGKIMGLVTDPKPNTYNSLPFTTEARTAATRFFQMLRDSEYNPINFQLHGYKSGDRHNTEIMAWKEPLKKYIDSCCCEYKGNDPRMEGGIYPYLQCKLSEPIVGGFEQINLNNSIDDKCL